MTTESVQALLEDIRLVSEQNYEIVEAVRALVKETFETSKLKGPGSIYSQLQRSLPANLARVICLTPRPATRLRLSPYTRHALNLRIETRIA